MNDFKEPLDKAQEAMQSAHLQMIQATAWYNEKNKIYQELLAARYQEQRA